MAKRPRCLLGLGALFVWQTGLTRCFVPSLVQKAPPRTQKASEKLLHYRPQHVAVPASTCPLFVRPENGEEAPLNDGEYNKVERLSLTELLEELDRREIRYAPTATRRELEELLLQSNISQVKTEKSPSLSALSLQDIIEELNRRNIRFPPTASRKELEAVLQNDFTVDDGLSITKFERTESTYDEREYEELAMKPTNEYSLTELLQELDRRQIRYPPTASRMQLEALLLRSAEKQPANTDESTRTMTRETIVTVETASEEADEVNRLDKGRNRRRAASRRSEIEEDLVDDQPPSSDRRMPLATLLSELDRLDIRYPPTASRTELEVLLNQSLKQQALHEQRRRQRRRQRDAREGQDSSSVKRLIRKSTRVASKSVQKLPRKVSRIATSPQITSRISGVAERAARQAKRVSRKASEFWNTDENGIRDVQFEYVSVDQPIDVRAVRMDEDEPPPRRPSSPGRSPRPTRQPRSNDQQRRPSSPRTRIPRSSPSQQPSQWQSDGRIPKARRPRPARPSTASWQADRRIPKQRRRRPVSRQKVETSLGSSSFMLPPASQNAIPFQNVMNTSSTTEPPIVSNVTSGERQRRTPIGKKKVYSAYVYDEDGEIEGPFDQLGDFLTNSVDRWLWGPDDDNNNDDEKTADAKTRERWQRTEPSEKKRKQAKSSAKKQKPRYWKDRLAEQVDYALGIHEDGEYYNSWEKQLDEEQRRIERHGPEFWESRTPKGRRRRPSAKNEVKYKRPLWEEDGSLISLVLGRTKRGGQLQVERLLDRARGDNRMVTTFFNSVLQSILLVSTYVCRWASVRGTVPQPIVVIGVISSFLSARPGYRFRTVLVALLACRTAGELLHGYAYGNEDWGEEGDDDDEALVVDED